MNTPLSATDLMHQAGDTAGAYFSKAVRIIDEKFGKDYAQNNPGLVGDFMKTAARDFDTVTQIQQSEEMINATNHLADSVSDMSSAIGDQMSKSSGDQLEGLTRVSKSIDGLASAVENTAAPKSGR